MATNFITRFNYVNTFWHATGLVRQVCRRLGGTHSSIFWVEKLAKEAASSDTCRLILALPTLRLLNMEARCSSETSVKFLTTMA
jgi:hypothetical protein